MNNKSATVQSPKVVLHTIPSFSRFQFTKCNYILEWHSGKNSTWRSKQNNASLGFQFLDHIFPTVTKSTFNFGCIYTEQMTHNISIPNNSLVHEKSELLGTSNWGKILEIGGIGCIRALLGYIPPKSPVSTTEGLYHEYGWRRYMSLSVFIWQTAFDNTPTPFFLTIVHFGGLSHKRGGFKRSQSKTSNTCTRFRPCQVESHTNRLEEFASIVLLSKAKINRKIHPLNVEICRILLRMRPRRCQVLVR